MHDVGFKLGSLIYLLDAYEDYEKDGKAGDFNALKAALRISEARLPVRYRELATRRMWQMAAEIETSLIELPISAERAQVFAARLRSNLAHRVGRRLPVLQRPPASDTQGTATAGTALRGCSCSSARIGFRSRWREALRLGRSILDQRRRERPAAFTLGFEAPFIFVSVMAVALLFPLQARTVSSYRECIGIAFNLMFVTALLRSLLVAPFRTLLFSTPVNPGPEEPLPGEPGRAPGVGPPPQYTVGPPPGEPAPPHPPAPEKKRGCSCCDCDCCDADCCDCCDCCSGCDC
jgi:hypothetical protein